jgi:hypothetical protein
MRLGRIGPMLCSVHRLSAKRSSIPRRGHRTCGCTEERALLASISTIVAVAGQTQEHPATIAGIGAATVPRMVPTAFPASGLRETDVSFRHRDIRHGQLGSPCLGCRCQAGPGRSARAARCGVVCCRAWPKAA